MIMQYHGDVTSKYTKLKVYRKLMYVFHENYVAKFIKLWVTFTGNKTKQRMFS